MNQGGILWLDLSHDCGWAYGTRDAAMPLTGVWPFNRHLGVGPVLATFESEALVPAIKHHRPSLIGIEAALPPKVQSSTHSAELLIGMAGVTAKICHQAGIRFVRRSVSQVRAQVIGRAARTNAEIAAGIDVKSAIVLPWIAAQGWGPMNHNAADAAVGWSFEVGRRFNSRLV